MTNFQINDIVIITKDPPNQIVKIKGSVGYIQEFQEHEGTNFVYFKTIELGSFCGGMGSVPIDCIAKYNDEKYNKRLEEIFENERKENEKNNLIQKYCKLEKALEDNIKEIMFLERFAKDLNDLNDQHFNKIPRLVRSSINKSKLCKK